jgi:transcriptional regulator with XRE-family HTH domain
LTPLQFKRTRLKLGLKTQAQAAEAMGVCQGTVSLYESGGRPVPKTIIKLLECLEEKSSSNQ